MAEEEAPRNGQSYLQRLKQGEQHVFWKLSLRTVIIIFDIICMGCSAWLLANALQFNANPYMGYFSGPEVSPWALVVCGLSFIFCLVCILVLLLRKPPRPAHPGIAVGCDLILWLAFIVTALFATFGAIYLSYFGNDGDTLSDPSSYNGEYSGEYYLAPNNTWIYNITSVSPYSASSTGGIYSGSYGNYFWNSTRGSYQLNNTMPSTSSVHRDCSSAAFVNCREQDAYINHLWHTRHQRFATEIVAAALQWINMLLHFVLFVWACVDTHRYNREFKQKKVNAVADRVIQDMQARGLITVNTAAAARAGAPEGQPLMAERSVSAGNGVAGPSEQR